MPDLTATTALGGPTPRAAGFGPLTLTENPGLALASLALRCDAATPTPLGLTLPGPGVWSDGAGVSALWTGPGQWMVEAPGRAEQDFAAALAAEAPGCSVTEQTDGWVAVEIASTRGAAPILTLAERLLNLPPEALAPGKGTRTGLHHMSVLVIRRAPDRLAVLGMRSAAGSLWHALELAAQRLETTE